MKLFRLLFPGIVALFLIGCASRGEIETMKEQLNYLYESSSQMQGNVSRLDSLYKLTIEENVRYQADLRAQLAEMIDKMSTIDGRLTDIERRIANLEEVRPRSTYASTPRDTATQKEPTSTQPQVDFNKMFDNAFTDLKAGNYDLAILQFEELIRIFPDTPRTDDAQYWLGECYYGKRDYAKALPEFEKVEKNFTNSDKLGPALFKVARCYEETGNTARACATFTRITKEMSGSFEARQAGDKLKDLQCP